jgi:type VI secretion system secreted protein Hcp
LRGARASSRTPAGVPFQYFLKVDGIQGESSDAKHVGEIELESFGFGVAEPIAHGAGGGAVAAKPTFHDFHFVAHVSKASPKLFLACASGQHITHAVLTCRRSGPSKQEFLVVFLSDVLVTSYELQGDEEDPGPTDLVSLAYGKLQVEYRAQKADGSLEAPVKAGWDVKQNKKA